MSALFNSLSEELFQVIKGSGKTITLFDVAGNKTYDPSVARRLFATPGNFMASVQENGSDSQVQLFLSDSTDVRDMSRLINTLRQISTRYNVLFNVRKFGKELSPKDFAFQAVSEATMWGSTRTSYQKINSAKLIIRHTVPVREGIIGSRGRNILSMFVETNTGERFRFPENHLSGGRAFANHIANGGKPHDATSLQIVDLANESLTLSNVNRFIYHSRKSLSEDASNLRPVIRSRIVEIRKAFTAMSRPRGYTRVVESGLPVLNTTLTENDDFGKVLENLKSLLQINSNHALAESLMPVALLTMGENMNTINEMFSGVITLDEALADALLEALLSEYGHLEESMTQMGSNFVFHENAAFEDAKSILDIMESAYSINEETAIANYIQMMENDLNGEIMDESSYNDDAAFSHGVDDYVERFEPLLFLQEYFPEALDDTIDAADRTISRASVISNITHDINLHLESMDIHGANEEGLKSDAAHLFDKFVAPELAKLGTTVTESDLVEFAPGTEKPGRPDIAVGDYVSSDIGSGQVSEVDGDIATVEFLHGGSKQIHIDDLDKVGQLGGVQEENDLAEWFNEFTPESVLEAGPNWANAIPQQAKAAPSNDEFDGEIGIGDRVTHKAYGSGTVTAKNDKLAKVEFDDAHARLPDSKTVSLHKGTLTKAGAYRKPDIRANEVNESQNDDTFDTTVDLIDADDVPVTVTYEVLDDEPEIGMSGGVSVTNVERKDTGEDIIDQLDNRTISMLRDEVEGELRNHRDDAAEYRYNMRRDETLDESDDEDFETHVNIGGMSVDVKVQYHAEHDDQRGDSYVEVDDVFDAETGESIIGQLNRMDVKRLESEIGDYLSNEMQNDPYESIEESLGGDLGVNLVDEVKEDPNRDIYDMSNEELTSAYANAPQGRGTMDAVKRMDKIKDEMTRRGLNIEEHVTESSDEINHIEWTGKAARRTDATNPYDPDSDKGRAWRRGYTGQSEGKSKFHEAEQVDEAFRAELSKLIKNARFRM